jgi:hypothetical protein
MQKNVVAEDIVIDERLMSKWGSSIMHDQHISADRFSPSKARLTSEMLSVEEDSIEDRDFSLSKDSGDINLSDLHYSKLMKIKQNKA